MRRNVNWKKAIRLACGTAWASETSSDCGGTFARFDSSGGDQGWNCQFRDGHFWAFPMRFARQVIL